MMKISPMMTTANTVGAMEGSAPQPPSMRSVKMNTNATPLSYAPPGDAGSHVPEPEEKKELVEESAPEATKPISPQFAALAKQRRALQLKERELQEREKALGQKPATQADTIDIERLRSEPMRVLLESGVTYDQLTKAVLEQQGTFNPEIHELKQKLAALESGVEEKLQAREQQQYDQAVSEMRREASQLAAEGDRFEMIRTEGRVSDVVKLIEKVYETQGELLSVESAMEMVENQLMEDAIERAKVGKVWNKLSPEVPSYMQQKSGMRTLTNRDTAQAPLSAKQRAIAAFYGQLKR
jgi:hypothetical protein